MKMRQLVNTTCYERECSLRALLYKPQSTLKFVSNTRVFLTQKNDDLPLVVDELVGVFTLKLVDELDEVAVKVLVKALCAQVRQLTLAFDVVDADLALFPQFLHEKTPHSDVLCARTVGPVAPQRMYFTRRL